MKMQVNLAAFRHDKSQELNYSRLGQEIRAYMDDYRQIFRDVFKDFVKSRLSRPGAEGLNISEIVSLALQSVPNRTFAEGIMLLYYVFDLNPGNARKELLAMLEEAHFRMTDRFNRNQFIVAEDYLGLRRGTLYDLDNWD